jgi:hypothetical protein
MPEDDSTQSTDVVDVLRGALAAPWLRVFTLWLVSAAGTAPALFLDQLLHGGRESQGYSLGGDYDFWLVTFGVPISFVGSIVEGVYNEHLRADAIEWLLRVLLLAATLVWLRAAIRVCAGRWLATSLAHLFAASFFIATGRFGNLWWVGTTLTAVMIVVWFKWPGFRELRAAETDYERDGI